MAAATRSGRVVLLAKCSFQLTRRRKSGSKVFVSHIPRTGHERVKAGGSSALLAQLRLRNRPLKSDDRPCHPLEASVTLSLTEIAFRPFLESEGLPS